MPYTLSSETKHSPVVKPLIRDAGAGLDESGSSGVLSTILVL